MRVDDGVYDAIGKFMDLVRSPESSIEDLLAFQSIAESVQSGAISHQEAAAKVAAIGAAYLDFWKWFTANGVGIANITAIISVCILCYSLIQQIGDSDESHRDAQAHLQAIEQLTQVSWTEAQAPTKSEEVQQKIYELLAQQQKAGAAAVPEQQRGASMPPLLLMQNWWPTTVSHNPHVKPGAQRRQKNPPKKP